MLKIYNTLTRTKEIFTLREENKDSKLITMYNCGPTVYSYVHIGNLRAFLMADSIRRSLEFLGYDVKQVMNYTDVGHLTSDEDNGEDKLEKGARLTGKTVWEVAEFFIEAAEKDFQKMNFLVPQVRPRATEHIKEQISMVQDLLDKGFAYDTQEAVYFDTSKLADYGKLTGQKLSDKLVGVRDDVNVDENKKNNADFRLWQYCIGEFANHTMRWQNSWNDKPGFPGWHIECSAMAKAHLGTTIDIHTGGVDHIPVHHTNEIAQSECANGELFARYWIHNEFILVDNKKMSKSLGNFYTLADLEEKGFSAMDLRYYYLTANFRKVQNITIAELEKIKEAKEKVMQKIAMIKSSNNDAENIDIELLQKTEEYSKFIEALEDSFNMPVALSILLQVVNGKLDNSTKLGLIKLFDNVLGLKLV